MIKPEAWELGSLKEGEFSTVLGANKRRVITLVSAVLTGVGIVIAYNLTESLKTSQSWLIILAWLTAGASVTYLLSRLKERSEDDSPEAIKTRVAELHSELRSQVQSRSYGARSKLIAAPLTELDLDITPRVGLVRDPRLTKPEPISEENTDIVAAFTSSKRRLLIVGEPGSGKTTAAYDVIEHLDETEGDERVALLVNLSAWEAQENFEAFLVDYLLSEIGYQFRKPAVARAFIRSRRYSLVLDGLDEIPAGLRGHFSERLNKFVEGLASEVAVVVTCRTQEYQELFATHPTGIGLVQAVEILPLSNQQLDSAFVALAEFDDKNWEMFVAQPELLAHQQARNVLKNPLFLNLAVSGRLLPGELLLSDEEQELRDLVLERYLDSSLVDQSEYARKDVRRYLSWIARFLNGVVVSPFGLKTSDSTVLDLADLTPPDPQKQDRLLVAMSAGLVFGVVYSLGYWLYDGVIVLLQISGMPNWMYSWVFDYLLGPGLVDRLVEGLIYGLGAGLLYGLIVGLLTGWPFKRSAVSSRLIVVFPSTRQQLLGFLRSFRRGLFFGLVGGFVAGMIFALGEMTSWGDRIGLDDLTQISVAGLITGLVGGLVGGLVFGLVEPRSLLITSRTPKDASSRSRIAALFWLVFGLVMGVVGSLSATIFFALFVLQKGLRPDQIVHDLFLGLSIGLVFGLVFGLRNGGGFVLLQKVAHRRLAKAGNLPPRPADFLIWGIEQQIFRRVGGGVRFRHSLIQQHLANTSAGKLL